MHLDLLKRTIDVPGNTGRKTTEITMDRKVGLSTSYGRLLVEILVSNPASPFYSVHLILF